MGELGGYGRLKFYTNSKPLGKIYSMDFLVVEKVVFWLYVFSTRETSGTLYTKSIIVY